MTINSKAARARKHAGCRLGAETRRKGCGGNSRNHLLAVPVDYDSRGGT